MRIALFGGVFNPPHNGHIMIARQVLDFADCESLWFLPNYGQSFEKENVPDPEIRRKMVEKIVFSGASVSTIEIDNKLDGKTINLLPHLPEGNDYTFVVGADQLPVFEKWGNWQELVEKLNFLVFPRYGYYNEPLYKNMTVLTSPFLMTSDISSTKIRDRVKNGLSISEFVPRSVEEYIREHKLYQI